MTRRVCILHFAFFIQAASAAWAHPFSVSYGQFVVSGARLEAILRLPMDDVDLLFRLDRDLDGTVAPIEIERARAVIERYLSERVTVRADGRELRGRADRLGTWQDRDGAPYLEAAIQYAASDDIETLSIRATLLADLYPDHRTLARIRTGERTDDFVFQRGNTYERRAASRWATFRSFLVLGVEHIVTGYDHMMFLFGLLLVGRGFRNLVATVTSFTAAHSLTLALATFGLLDPAAWTIEAAIALSIAYIGFENLFVKDIRHRWKIAFAFGLIHGFGFANVLREMDLSRAQLATSLFSFNLGVEIGQVCIVALMFPVIQYVGRTRYQLALTRVASAVILAVGLVWFYQRIR